MAIPTAVSATNTSISSASSGSGRWGEPVRPLDGAPLVVHSPPSLSRQRSAKEALRQSMEAASPPRSELGDEIELRGEQPRRTQPQQRQAQHGHEQDHGHEQERGHEQAPPRSPQQSPERTSSAASTGPAAAVAVTHHHTNLRIGSLVPCAQPPYVF